jgi:hypothetical protein
MRPMILGRGVSSRMIMSEVEERPTYKLLSQFEHVDNATPLARNEDGKISLGSAHGTGPQLIDVSGK